MKLQFFLNALIDHNIFLNNSLGGFFIEVGPLNFIDI